MYINVKEYIEQKSLLMQNSFLRLVESNEKFVPELEKARMATRSVGKLRVSGKWRTIYHPNQSNRIFEKSSTIMQDVTVRIIERFIRVVREQL